jgi:hypothetical protein
MRIESIGKSLLLAAAGAGMVSFFLMMTIIPVEALMQRLRGNVAQQSEVVNPAAFMRTYGLGLAAAAFAVLFVMALLRFRREEQAALRN